MSKHSGALARRYGTALFETLVDFSNNKTDFEKAVDIVREISLIFSKNVVSFFLLPSLTHDEKFQILEFLLQNYFKNNKFSDENGKNIISFLKLIIVNHRLHDIQPIFSFFLTRADEYLEIARATVISARTVQLHEAKEFEATIQSVLHKKIVLKSETDESLKAGFVVKLGHINIDASFKARLNSLKELFI